MYVCLNEICEFYAYMYINMVLMYASVKTSCERNTTCDVDTLLYVTKENTLPMHDQVCEMNVQMRVIGREREQNRPKLNYERGEFHKPFPFFSIPFTSSL